MQKQSLTASDVGINDTQTPVKPPLNLPETGHVSDTTHEPSFGAFEQFEAYAHSQAAQSGQWSPRVARLTPAMAGSETKHEVHSPALQGIKQPRRQKAQRKNRAPDTPSKRHVATTSAKASDAHVAPNATTPIESIQELQEVFSQSKRQKQQTFSIVRISNHGTEDSIIASRSHEGVYRSLIDEIISENWLAMPLDGPESIHIHGATVIEFKIRRTGRVANVELTKTSGHSILDIVALNSIPKRLPRLPREVGKKMRHQYTFRYINPSLEK